MITPFLFWTAGAVLFPLNKNFHNTYHSSSSILNYRQQSYLEILLNAAGVLPPVLDHYLLLQGHCNLKILLAVQSILLLFCISLQCPVELCPYTNILLLCVLHPRQHQVAKMLEVKYLETKNTETTTSCNRRTNRYIKYWSPEDFWQLNRLTVIRCCP